MKTSGLLIGLVALVSLMSTASFGAPSSLGPSGILNVPTTEVVPKGRTEIMLAYDRPTVAGNGIDVFPVVTVQHGFTNGEIGVSYFNVRGNKAVKSANLKYILAPQTQKSPGVAAGVMYLRGNTAETDLYLIASHNLGLDDNFRATVGLLYQKPSHVSNDHFTGMLGMEYGRPGKTSIGIDYIVKDIAAGSLYGAMIRQPITPDITWQIGVGNRSRFFTGLTYQFGGK
jgi:hypothetical protein